MSLIRMRKSMAMVLLLGGALWTMPALAEEGFDPAFVMYANLTLANASDQPLPPVDLSEQEAQLWVLNAGYNQVSGLTRDGNYLYRGTALLDGATYDIVVDAEGNILGARN